MIALTATQLGYRALRDIGWLRAGQTTLNAGVQQDCLDTLNSLVDMANAESMMIPTITRTVFATVAGQQAYTVGAGGNWNIPRPAQIDRAGVIVNPSSQYPQERELQYFTYDQWAVRIANKNAPGVPSVFYPDNGSPLTTILLWPVPQASELPSIALYYSENLTEFANQGTSYTFRPAYAAYLEWNLAEMLWPRFQENSPMEGKLWDKVQSMATRTRAVVKRFNAPIKDIRGDSSLTRPRWGWNQGNGLGWY